MIADPTIINENSTIYTYCKQNLLNRESFVIPLIPSFQNNNWMTEDQEVIVSVFCWSSILIITMIFLFFLKTIIYRIWAFYKGQQNLSRGRHIHIPFSHVKCGAYIPQIKSQIIVAFPFFACDIDEITDQDMISWESPYHPHKYYDLTEDAKEILEKAGLEGTLSKSAFSQVMTWA